ncbi:hypothetical protein CEUSTIGMA_g4852.t1 [Chlamydomonas eustigma]|uniref:DUF3641 domain-containing protein n=1 Tax=Chlamydomonas eustigma TaxID=1157962 RepID=A0A250X2Y0_9CHLO|nr:hypothetical protein CEUSTIGMA_g4852.t1 [Chlamydomonas eustigma]|eukprot:GAX77406.1 hypothetical protein CEUSTIGMA_g4852.t1 [Chlamydomonas eustigma]
MNMHSSVCTLTSVSLTPRFRPVTPRCNQQNSCAVRESLVPTTLKEMEDNPVAEPIVKQSEMTRLERIQRQRALDKLSLPQFEAMCQAQGVPDLCRSATKTLQLNIGLYCNQACTHCHVESSPKRTEMMDHATAEACVRLMRSSPGILSVDITGGAPELNDQFRYLVTQARCLGLEVIDRCNLTVLLEPGQEDLPAFLAANKVQVVASLPCYGPTNVDKQRGAGVFDRSIEALKMLNALGYGCSGSEGLQLNLVYNPGGAFLAPAQAALEAAYREELRGLYGIEFNHLYCLNNMPIKRFADSLVRQGQMEQYMQLLVNSFNPQAGPGLMCRDTVSVGWDGRLYDCDFNQQLDMSLTDVSGLSTISTAIFESDRRISQRQTATEVTEIVPGIPNTTNEEDLGPNSNLLKSIHRSQAVPDQTKSLTVFDIASLAELEGRRIRSDNHCYGCMAGSGSSCTGAAVAS